MARELRPDIEIIDRCNLTVLQEPGQEDLVDFLKDNRVSIVASLPCYSAENVDTQRGNGVFERSISALLALNEAGYGTELPMDLVYNPLGAFLPPPQADLEVKYKEELGENFGILFRSLFTMTNMPIKRFADFLHRRDELKDYLDLLVRNFNADTTTSLMCLNTVSVGHDGKVRRFTFFVAAVQHFSFEIASAKPYSHLHPLIYCRSLIAILINNLDMELVQKLLMKEA